MNKKRKDRGFTMAEMLIVVGIIIVLAGVAFIAVANHQRSMAQLERDTIAKEIFVAAQNHLTMAESQGYLPDTNNNVDFGTQEGSITTDTGRTYTNVYSFSVSGGSAFTGNSILDLMLPFASIDESVRSGGSYIIRYQAKPAIVLDVFYCPKAASSSGQLRFTHDLGSNTYDDVVEYAGEGKDRKNCLSDRCVLGWYGGAEAGDSGEYIKAPTIEVINKERLIVKIFDPNNSVTTPDSPVSLCLIITGEKKSGENEASRAQAAIQLANTTNDRFKWVAANDDEEAHYEVILDDITTAIGSEDDGLHFYDLNRTQNGAITLKKNESGNVIPFKPGENITIQAVAYSNSALTNIAYSVERTTNSLFADSQPATDSTKRKALIGNFRHLGNLDVLVSGLDSSFDFTEAEQMMDFVKPEGTEDDMSWSGFVSAIQTYNGNDNPVSIYALSATTGTIDNCYRPVDLTYALDFNGNHHKIEGVKVDYAQDAGLFGTIGVAGSKVHDLELVDFSITTSTGNAGALVGKLTQDVAFGADDENPFNISNVVAYHTDGKADTAKIIAASGNAGGLIGQTEGEHFKIEKSAASLVVSSTVGDAGGLIGKAAGGTVTGCYAGGHAVDSTTTNAVIYKPGEYNVTASAVAGGLIGDAGATEISYSYSTCSATGATVGGLIGTGSSAITYSYCTGLVKSTASAPVEGAFAGSWTYTDQDKEDGNRYFDIVNERDEKDGSGKLTGGYTYLDPVPGSPTIPGLTALDESAAQFNEFCPAPTDWSPALPYEATLKAYYGEGSGDKRVARYNLKTVEQLGAAVTKNSGAEGDTTIDDFVTTHYGDWPAPEIFVVNTK